MDLIVKFLFLSGKYITCAAGKTILEIINHSVKIQRHVTRKYDHVTQMVGPYDNMLELMNARIEDNSISDMTTVNHGLCDTTFNAAEEIAVSEDLATPRAVRKDTEYEKIYMDLYEDLRKSSTELKHEMMTSKTSKCEKTVDKDIIPAKQMTVVQPQYVKQHFYGTCTNGCCANPGQVSPLVPLCDRYAHMTNLITEAPDDSYFKVHAFTVRESKPINVHSSAGIYNFKRALLGHEDSIDLSSKDFITDLQHEMHHRTFSSQVECGIDDHRNFNMLPTADSCTTFKTENSAANIQNCYKRQASWQVFESNLEKKLQRKIYRIINRNMSNISNAFANIDVEKQNRLHADLMKVNEIAFNKLEQKVTQILIQQNLKDIEDIFGNREHLRTIFPEVKRLNFEEICSNTSTRIQNAVIKGLQEKKVLLIPTGISDINELMEEQIKPAIFETRYGEFVTKLEDMLTLEDTRPFSNIAAPQERLQISKKIENETTVLSKDQSKSDIHSISINIERASEKRSLNLVELMAHEALPTRSHRVNIQDIGKTDLTDSDMEDIRQSTDILESNWRAFKIFEEYLHNVMILDKGEGSTDAVVEKKRNSLFETFSIESIYNSLFNRNEENKNGLKLDEASMDINDEDKSEYIQNVPPVIRHNITVTPLEVSCEAVNDTSKSIVLTEDTVLEVEKVNIPKQKLKTCMDILSEREKHRHAAVEKSINTVEKGTFGFSKLKTVTHSPQCIAVQSDFIVECTPNSNTKTESSVSDFIVECGEHQLKVSQKKMVNTEEPEDKTEAKVLSDFMVAEHELTSHETNQPSLPPVVISSNKSSLLNEVFPLKQEPTEQEMQEEEDFNAEGYSGNECIIDEAYIQDTNDAIESLHLELCNQQHAVEPLIADLVTRLWDKPTDYLTLEPLDANVLPESDIYSPYFEDVPQYLQRDNHEPFYETPLFEYPRIRSQRYKVQQEKILSLEKELKEIKTQLKSFSTTSLISKSGLDVVNDGNICEYVLKPSEQKEVAVSDTSKTYSDTKVSGAVAKPRKIHLNIYLPKNGLGNKFPIVNTAEKPTECLMQPSKSNPQLIQQTDVKQISNCTNNSNKDPEVATSKTLNIDPERIQTLHKELQLKTVDVERLNRVHETLAPSSVTPKEQDGEQLETKPVDMERMFKTQEELTKPKSHIPRINIDKLINIQRDLREAKKISAKPININPIDTHKLDTLRDTLSISSSQSARTLSPVKRKEFVEDITWKSKATPQKFKFSALPPYNRLAKSGKKVETPEYCNKVREEIKEVKCIKEVKTIKDKAENNIQEEGTAKEVAFTKVEKEIKQVKNTKPHVAITEHNVDKEEIIEEENVIQLKHAANDDKAVTNEKEIQGTVIEFVQNKNEQIKDGEISDTCIKGDTCVRETIESKQEEGNKKNQLQKESNTLKEYKSLQESAIIKREKVLKNEEMLKENHVNVSKVHDENKGGTTINERGDIKKDKGIKAFAENRVSRSINETTTNKKETNQNPDFQIAKEFRSAKELHSTSKFQHIKEFKAIKDLKEIKEVQGIKDFEILKNQVTVDSKGDQTLSTIRVVDTPKPDVDLDFQASINEEGVMEDTISTVQVEAFKNESPIAKEEEKIHFEEVKVAIEDIKPLVKPMDGIKQFSRPDQNKAPMLKEELKSPIKTEKVSLHVYAEERNDDKPKINEIGKIMFKNSKESRVSTLRVLFENNIGPEQVSIPNEVKKINSNKQTNIDEEKSEVSAKMEQCNNENKVNLADTFRNMKATDISDIARKKLKDPIRDKMAEELRGVLPNKSDTLKVQYNEKKEIGLVEFKEKSNEFFQKLLNNSNALINKISFANMNKSKREDVEVKNKMEIPTRIKETFTPTSSNTKNSESSCPKLRKMFPFIPTVKNYDSDSTSFVLDKLDTKKSDGSQLNDKGKENITAFASANMVGKEHEQSTKKADIFIQQSRKICDRKTDNVDSDIDYIIDPNSSKSSMNRTKYVRQEYVEDSPEKGIPEYDRIGQKFKTNAELKLSSEDNEEDEQRSNIFGRKARNRQTDTEEFPDEPDDKTSTQAPTPADSTFPAKFTTVDFPNVAIKMIEIDELSPQQPKAHTEQPTQDLEPNLMKLSMNIDDNSKGRLPQELVTPQTMMNQVDDADVNIVLGRIDDTDYTSIELAPSEDGTTEEPITNVNDTADKIVEISPSRDSSNENSELYPKPKYIEADKFTLSRNNPSDFFTPDHRPPQQFGNSSDGGGNNSRRKPDHAMEDTTRNNENKTVKSKPLSARHENRSYSKGKCTKSAGFREDSEKQSEIPSSSVSRKPPIFQFKPEKTDFRSPGGEELEESYNESSKKDLVRENTKEPMQTNENTNLSSVRKDEYSARDHSIPKEPRNMESSRNTSGPKDASSSKQTVRPEADFWKDMGQSKDVGFSSDSWNTIEEASLSKEMGSHASPKERQQEIPKQVSTFSNETSDEVQTTKEFNQGRDIPVKSDSKQSYTKKISFEYQPLNPNNYMKQDNLSQDSLNKSLGNNCKILIRSDADIGTKSTQKLEEEFDEFESKFVALGSPEAKSSVEITKQDTNLKYEPTYHAKDKPKDSECKSHLQQTVRPLQSPQEHSTANVEEQRSFQKVTVPKKTEQLCVRKPPRLTKSPDEKPPQFAQQQQQQNGNNQLRYPNKPMIKNVPIPKPQNFKITERVERTDRFSNTHRRVLEDTYEKRRAGETSREINSMHQQLMQQHLQSKQNSQNMKSSISDRKSELQQPGTIHIKATCNSAAKHENTINETREINPESKQENVEQTDSTRELQNILQKQPAQQICDNKHVAVQNQTAQIRQEFDTKSLGDKVQQQLESLHKIVKDLPKQTLQIFGKTVVGQNNSTPSQDDLQSQPEMNKQQKFASLSQCAPLNQQQLASPEQDKSKIKRISRRQKFTSDYSLSTSKLQSQPQLQPEQQYQTLSQNIECDNKENQERFQGNNQKSNGVLHKSFEFKPLREIQQYYKNETVQVETKSVPSIIKSYEFNYMEALPTTKEEVAEEKTVVKKRVSTERSLERTTTIEEKKVESNENKKVIEEKKTQIKEIVEDINTPEEQLAKRIDEDKMKVEEFLVKQIVDKPSKNPQAPITKKSLENINKVHEDLVAKRVEIAKRFEDPRNPIETQSSASSIKPVERVRKSEDSRKPTDYQKPKKSGKRENTRRPESKSENFRKSESAKRSEVSRTTGNFSKTHNSRGSQSLGPPEDAGRSARASDDFKGFGGNKRLEVSRSEDAKQLEEAKTTSTPNLSIYEAEQNRLKLEEEERQRQLKSTENINKYLTESKSVQERKNKQTRLEQEKKQSLKEQSVRQPFAQDNQSEHVPKITKATSSADLKIQRPNLKLESSGDTVIAVGEEPQIKVRSKSQDVKYGPQVYPTNRITKEYKEEVKERQTSTRHEYVEVEEDLMKPRKPEEKKSTDNFNEENSYDKLKIDRRILNDTNRFKERHTYFKPLSNEEVRTTRSPQARQEVRVPVSENIPPPIKIQLPDEKTPPEVESVSCKNYFPKISYDPVDYTLNLEDTKKWKEMQAKAKANIEKAKSAPYMFEYRPPKQYNRNPDKIKQVNCDHLGIIWPKPKTEEKATTEKPEKNKIFTTPPTLEMSTSAVLDKTAKRSDDYETDGPRVVYSFDDKYRKATDDKEIQQKKLDYWKTLRREDKWAPTPTELTIANELYGSKVLMKKRQKMKEARREQQPHTSQVEYGGAKQTEEFGAEKIKKTIKIETKAEKRLKAQLQMEEEDKRKYGNISPLLKHYLKQKEELMTNVGPTPTNVSQTVIMRTADLSENLPKEYNIQRRRDDQKPVVINVPTEGSVYDKYPLLRKDNREIEKKKKEDEQLAAQRAEYNELQRIARQKKEAERLSAEAALMAEERSKAIERKTSFANQTAVKFRNEPYANKLTNMMKWKLRYNAHIEKLNTSGGLKFEENKLVKKFPFLKKYRKASELINWPEKSAPPNWNQYTQLPYNPTVTGVRNVKMIDAEGDPLPSSLAEAVLPETSERKKYVFREKELTTKLGKTVKVTYLVEED